MSFVDQPNSGNSGGNFINSSFNEWVKTIVHFARKYLDEGYEIVLLVKAWSNSNRNCIGLKRN